MDDFSCEACIFGKHHKLPFHLSTSIAAKPFALVHTDLWGPYKISSMTGATYFLTIMDDNKRTTWTHLLLNKQQVFSIISTFP